MAGDVYAQPAHLGRGGWTWYTGAAGWMYRAGVESILGIRREGEFLIIQPCIPAEWPGFEATVNVGSGRYEIRVESLPDTRQEFSHAALDGIQIACVDGRVRVPLRSGTHNLSMSLAGAFTRLAPVY